jgi:hypothetical protein
MFAKSGTAQITLGAAWLIAGLALAFLWLRDEPQIEIVWQTESEFESAGFNVLRGQSQAGPYNQINERLIPASEDAAVGADYSFVDAEVTRGKLYFYQLEDVDLAGNATRHEPIAYVAPGRAPWLLAVGAASLLIGSILVMSWLRGQQRNHLS